MNFLGFEYLIGIAFGIPVGVILAGFLLDKRINSLIKTRDEVLSIQARAEKLVQEIDKHLPILIDMVRKFDPKTADKAYRIFHRQSAEIIQLKEKAPDS